MNLYIIMEFIDGEWVPALGKKRANDYGRVRAYLTIESATKSLRYLPYYRNEVKIPNSTKRAIWQIDTENVPYNNHVSTTRLDKYDLANYKLVFSSEPGIYYKAAKCKSNNQDKLNHMPTLFGRENIEMGQWLVYKVSDVRKSVIHDYVESNDTFKKYYRPI